MTTAVIGNQISAIFPFPLAFTAKLDFPFLHVQDSNHVNPDIWCIHLQYLVTISLFRIPAHLCNERLNFDRVFELLFANTPVHHSITPAIISEVSTAP